MESYFSMNRAALSAEKEALEKQYAAYKALGLKLNMARGMPCTEQLDLSQDMFEIQDFIGEDGFDARNYGKLEGMPEARRLFAELLGVTEQETIVAGNSSLQMMYYLIDLGWRLGFSDSPRPWREEKTLKFLCPVPGYDRHFRITEQYGFEMINVPMTPQGPDMDMVERLVASDPAIKGIWCVPVYSNPDGYVYSEETTQRLAAMQTAAPDFRILWDNAYMVHHLTDEECTVPNLLALCKKAGHAERPLLFCSTSKITFPGAGVAAFAASETTIQYVLKKMMPMIISFDKVNQLRHVKYLKNKQGVLEHMKLHRAVLAPKFAIVKDTFAAELAPCGEIAHWTSPKGGYFVSLYLQPGCAKRTADLCKDAGLALTGAGAAYPYGKDPEDSHLRIAPTYPKNEDLKKAMRLLTICVRIATVEKLLAD